ncbi:MAG: hypothetical protein G8345_15015 [Magnetococcales bacterium]|nr:hypothetical protein [Magnetococcales bacterium]NGZ28189.1 hypothetical protein [Magnetococcales bacterium]
MKTLFTALMISGLLMAQGAMAGNEPAAAPTTPATQSAGQVEKKEGGEVKKAAPTTATNPSNTSAPQQNTTPAVQGEKTGNSGNTPATTPATPAAVKN